MIPCHDTQAAVCYETTIESPAFPAAQNASVGLAPMGTDDEPRMVEILTVLNDVFDSFSIQQESGVLNAPFPA
jgi:hypothetical protein